MTSARWCVGVSEEYDLNAGKHLLQNQIHGSIPILFSMFYLSKGLEPNVSALSSSRKRSLLLSSGGRVLTYIVFLDAPISGESTILSAAS